jgi:hypothetical protein
MFGSIPFHVISRAVICGLAATNGVTTCDPNDAVIIIIIPMNNIFFFFVLYNLASIGVWRIYRVHQLFL